MNTVGIYIHIPFCVKKCNYCDFFSLKAEESLMDEYVSKLDNSLKNWADKISDRLVDTVYFGGGTPSVLGTSRLNRILDSVYKYCNIDPETEITIEINPESAHKLDFSSLASNGINRVSMGLQSADDEELRLLGRAHTVSEATDAIDRFKNGGIKNFSLDVMIGVPLQTFASLKKTIDFCVESGATHISAYMLKIEKNTPFYKNADKLTFADDDLQADLYEYAVSLLKEKDFRHYEISNFCRDNLISRHNMKYWQLEDYIGIGPSAHSLLDGKRYFYPRSFQDFYDDKLMYESEGCTPEEYIMLSLRTDTGVVFSKFKELFNLSLAEQILSEAKKLEKPGLVILDNNSIRLTEKGFLLSNPIISRLLNTEI